MHDQASLSVKSPAAVSAPRPPSVAGGLACGSLGLAGLALLRLATPVPAGWGHAVALCAAPVAVHRDGRTTVGCATDLARATGGGFALAAGDAVAWVDAAGADAGWRRLPRGMAAAQRLVLGLPLDLNVAGAADLAEVAGLSGRQAAAIVAFRAAHGPFARVAELMAVPGIGPRTLALIGRDVRAGAS